jgi:hypothetical protein
MVAVVLAYVFWHAPAAGVARDAYEERLAAFHAALRGSPPDGLGDTAVFALAGVPWLGGAAGYEDWYLVDGFAALGALNDAAVSGSRRRPHDAAAAYAAAGVAGVMGHVAGTTLPAGARWAAWTSKPAGLSYADAHAALAEAAGGADAAVWQRRMTLGPATEYCVLAGKRIELPWPVAHAWDLRGVVAPGGA